VRVGPAEDTGVVEAVQSQGEFWAATFVQQSNAMSGAEIIDFSSDRGLGGLMLAVLGGLKVRLITDALMTLDPDVRNACMNQNGMIVAEDGERPIERVAPYGYCCDRMQTVPDDQVQGLLRSILGSASHVFFSIRYTPTRNAGWLISELTKAGATIHWAEEREHDCAVYCGAWRGSREMVRDGKVNVDWSVLDEHVRVNINHGWRHITPHDKQDREVIILAGGPSMARYLPEIRKMREDGHALVTVNGSYNWALLNGLTPSMQIVVDAREFNARFTRPIAEGCKYLMASQVHPSTIEGLPWERTYLWHSGLSKDCEDLARSKVGFFYPIPGGSTVMLRAIPLLRMLGLHRFHIFGLDSCVIGNEHHSYSQPENDNELIAFVECGGRVFECTSWMITQAHDFQDLVRFMGDEIELAVYGDGLIAHMLETSATVTKEN
jgi:hypothetical protein